MMFVDFQHEGCPVVGCLFWAGPALDTYSLCRGEIARMTLLPRPDGRLSSLVLDAEVGKKRVFHISTAPARVRIKPRTTRTVVRPLMAPATDKTTADKTIPTRRSLPRSLRTAQRCRAVNRRTSPVMIEYKLGPAVAIRPARLASCAEPRHEATTLLGGSAYLSCQQG